MLSSYLMFLKMKWVVGDVDNFLRTTVRVAGLPDDRFEDSGLGLSISNGKFRSRNELPESLRSVILIKGEDDLG